MCIRLDRNGYQEKLQKLTGGFTKIGKFEGIGKARSTTFPTSL